MRLFLLLTALLPTLLYAQAQNWNGFFQTIDVTPYRGGEFRLTGAVRVDEGNVLSNARLWVQVEKEKGFGFFDNMEDRPITTSQWATYSIAGVIDKAATRIHVGGVAVGVARYYYDEFILECKTRQGIWSPIPLPNAGFEQGSFSDWKMIYAIEGFNTSLSTEHTAAGAQSLVIDATQRSTPSKLVDIGGITLHYQEFGQGETVLLLHGNRESLQAFNNQIPALAKTFHVVAMDSRGQGYSTEDGTALTYELMAEDVNALLEKLQLKNINVLGWSDGGNIGLLLAMKHPDKVKRLAIMGANLYNDATAVDKRINTLLINEKERLSREQKPAAAFQRSLIDLLLNEPHIRPETLRTITCPTLVMAGSNDIIKEGHTRLIASSIPNAQLVIFEKGTHEEPRENPERFNGTVLKFFAP